jgi:hypothetical protein
MRRIAWPTSRDLGVRCASLSYGRRTISVGSSSPIVSSSSKYRPLERRQDRGDVNVRLAGTVP